MDAEAIKRSLEGSGLRCTPQRYAVMAFLMEHNRHPTAAEIFEAVNRVDPRSSRATTYNNLRDLVQAGLVREVAVEGRAARFDAKGMRHHHFICDRCGNVEDIEWYDVPRPASGSLGKRILRECELIFRGLCTKCAPRRARPVKCRIGARRSAAGGDCANGKPDGFVVRHSFLTNSKEGNIWKNTIHHRSGGACPR
jgi:Fur family transcriptional regulator, peroxide stress response regulator